MQKLRFSSMEHHYPETKVKNVCAALNVSGITAKALLDRGIVDKKSALRYLSPTVDDLFDPMDLPDIRKAVERINRAIAGYERICIYGDYDTDGVCATAILYKQLKRMGALVECFVPSRHEDGYGMHDSTVELLCENGIDLIVTVDNGITANKEIRLCREYGVDVIVTDHHLPEDEIPECTAVVAATRKDSSYPFSALCGAAVAFKLCCALSGKIDNELLALAAVATIADVVPLVSENRMIVQLGLPYIRLNLGLSALLDVAGVNYEIDAKTIAFTVSPRLNAAGRLGDAGRAIALLTTNDSSDALQMADILQTENDRRRAEEERVIGEISDDYPNDVLAGEKIIIVKGGDWNPGVIGIVASKLLDKYYRPVILFTENQGNVVGSGRSIGGIHLHDAVTRFKDLFVRYGGHERAVGITILPDKFEFFKKSISEYFERTFSESVFVKEYEYEQEIDIEQITPALAEELKMLAPFGEGNPEPAFLCRDSAIQSVRRLGTNKEHLEGTAGKGNKSHRFIYFHGGESATEFENQNIRDILFNIRLNSFRGRTNVQLDLIASESVIENKSDFLSEMLYNENYSAQKLYNLIGDCVSLRDFSRDAMMKQFSLIAGLCGVKKSVTDFAKMENVTLIALAVFLELGFFRYTDGVLERTNRKCPLSDSLLYQKLMNS